MNKEIWKPVKGFEGFYEVSNLGNVKSLLNRYKNTKGIFLLKQETARNGYKRVMLSKPIRKKMLVHRLVAEAFIENPEEKLCVNHIDNNRSNNVVENIEWNTYSENLKHAQKQGRLFEAQSKGGVENGKKLHNKAIERAKEIVGKRFNSWRVLHFVEMKKISKTAHRAYLKCRCDCGLEKDLDIHYLTKRATHCSECSYKKRKGYDIV